MRVRRGREHGEGPGPPRQGNRGELPQRIREHLLRRGVPESSARLVERFLRISASSEETATRLIAPILALVGARYEEGSGWCVPSDSAARDGDEGPVVVAVIADRAKDRLVCCLRDGEAPIPASSIPWGRAHAVVASRAADGGWVTRWLLGRGLPPPSRVVSLRTALRGVGRLPRDASLETCCEALGVRWLDSIAPEGHAVAMAACLAEAEARRRELGLDKTGDAASVEYPGTITADQIGSLPEGPGVYRFFDRDDSLIYVGKAANLRRRVSSYFNPRRHGGHGERFLDRIHRLEFDALPSELEALLEESKQIRRKRPKGNVQFDVHDRAHPPIALGASRCWALLLPAPAGGSVTAVLVRDGTYLGRISIGPRGGGLARAEGLLGRAVRGPGRPARRHAGEDRETQILKTWLSKHGDAVSRCDLGDCRKSTEAARRLQEAARRVHDDAGPVEYR